MTTQTANPASAHQRLAAFLTGKTPERVFVEPTCHPALPTGFCFCEQSPLAVFRLAWRGFWLETLLRLPWNGPKLWYLRRLGAKIGNNVYISASAWIDPLFPQLLTIEDQVFIGMGARILTHEFRVDQFRAGKVVLRSGAFIGAFSVIGSGIEVGNNATVAACAVVGRDVPAQATAIGNPATMVPRM
ncbi:MAG TPA: acyltransferase [Planctomycetota bacterium]|jgi:hypothetical protein